MRKIGIILGRMEKELWPNFAIMNGTELDAAPAAGRLVKVVF